MFYLAPFALTAGRASLGGRLPRRTRRRVFVIAAVIACAAARGLFPFDSVHRHPWRGVRHARTAAVVVGERPLPRAPRRFARRAGRVRSPQGCCSASYRAGPAGPRALLSFAAVVRRADRRPPHRTAVYGILAFAARRVRCSAGTPRRPIPTGSIVPSAATADVSLLWHNGRLEAHSVAEGGPSSSTAASAASTTWAAPKCRGGLPETHVREPPDGRLADGGRCTCRACAYAVSYTDIAGTPRSLATPGIGLDAVPSRRAARRSHPRRRCLSFRLGGAGVARLRTRR